MIFVFSTCYILSDFFIGVIWDIVRWFSGFFYYWGGYVGILINLNVRFCCYSSIVVFNYYGGVRGYYIVFVRKKYDGEWYYFDNWSVLVVFEG